MNITQTDKLKWKIKFQGEKNSYPRVKNNKARKIIMQQDIKEKEIKSGRSWGATAKISDLWNIMLKEVVRNVVRYEQDIT